MELNDFKPSDKLYVILERNYRLMQIVARFNITMGFAEKTVSEVCHQHHVDVHTFLAVINLTNNFHEGKSYQVSLDLLNMKSLLDYLKRVHEYMLNYQLPRMRKNLFSAMDCSLHNEVAFLLVKYFDMYVDEIRSHIELEEKELHTYAEHLIEGAMVLESKIVTRKHSDEFVSKLHELINMFLQYYPQEGVNYELNDVIYNLYRIENDIDIHCCIEDQMLLPLIRRIERRRMSAKPANAVVQAEQNISSVSQMLSDREQAIAVCVAKGLANKEIADQLNISINTVTTHRRNIARKLNIHSSAGIAIFCVVNKLVKLEDINL